MLPNWLYGKSKSKLTSILGVPTDYDQIKAQINLLTEDVKDNLEIIDISSTFFTKYSDAYVVNDPHVFKQGKHIFGVATISKTSNFGSSQETLGTLTYPPVSNVNTFCALGTDRYSAPTRMGYLWLDANLGLIYIKAPGGTDSIVKIIFDYVTA